MSEPIPEKVAPPSNSAAETHRRDEHLDTCAYPASLSNAPASGTAPLTEMFGRYRILRQLGRGGMGTVYLAHDRQLDRQVALKVPQFDPETEQQGLERFFREARVMASLRHPNLCPVYDVDEIRGTHYLTMAFIDGQPLSALFRPLWTQRDVAVLFQKLARAVHVAHKAGVIHRDLKPANIMIEQGEPIIMDFGLARRDFPDETALTHSGTIVGTPAYMSPEQVAGEKTGPATDIYSLGVILYQMLSGDLPFQGSLVTVLGQIVTQEPRPLRELRADVDPTLDQICRKSMAKKPADRFADAAEFAEAFAAYLRGLDQASNTLEATQNFVRQSPAMIEQRPSGAPAASVVEPAETGRSPETARTTLAGSAVRRTLLITGALAALVVAVGVWQFLSAARPRPDLGPTTSNLLRPPPVDVASATPSSETATTSGDAAPPQVQPPPQESPPPETAPPQPALRDIAIAALAAGEFASAIARFDEVLAQVDARDEDFGHRARARLGLAETGDNPALNFGLAAADFERAKLFQEQAQARYAAALAFARQADALASERPADDKPLVVLDEQTLAEYRAAIALAEKYGLATATDWATELAGFQARPRIKQRAAMAQAREEIQTHFAAAKTLLQQAGVLANDRSADDPQLVELDQKAVAELQAALGLAEQHQEAHAAERIQAELAKLESSSRWTERAALKHLREEMQVLTKQLGETPHDPQILWRLAETEEKLGLKAESQQHLALSLGLSAMLAARTGELPAAEAAVAAAHTRAPESPHTLAARGWLALRQANPLQAVASFSAALQSTLADAADRWWLLRDRSTARAQLARAAGPSADASELRRALEDIEAAIEAGPTLPEGTDAPPGQRAERAELFAAKGSLAEELDAIQPATATLQDAAEAFEQAALLDGQTLTNPLGVARTMLKLLDRTPAAARPNGALAKIEQALSAVFALNQEWPEAHALRGELQLLCGDVVAARSAFERALAGPDPNPARQHGYWCNLSQAYLHAPADARRALDAAERAIALDDRLAAGHYCRGSALRSLQRAPEAQQEFDHVLAVQPKHVGAMLARSQLAVENPGITTAQIDQVLKDIATALALAPTEALQAEAYYVQSLAWLKYHLADKKSEVALLNCQNAVWEAIQRAPRNAVYQKTADQVFNYAAGFTWQDKTHQQDSARFQQQYQSRPRD